MHPSVVLSRFPPASRSTSPAFLPPPPTSPPPTRSTGLTKALPSCSRLNLAFISWFFEGQTCGFYTKACDCPAQCPCVAYPLSHFIVTPVIY